MIHKPLYKVPAITDVRIQSDSESDSGHNDQPSLGNKKPFAHWSNATQTQTRDTFTGVRSTHPAETTNPFAHWSNATQTQTQTQTEASWHYRHSGPPHSRIQNAVSGFRRPGRDSHGPGRGCPVNDLVAGRKIGPLGKGC